ncbi:hypothetical protein FANTH_9865 [Fusarium anthophilum]|uniref:Copper-fist domain-containing protein n=1 Tax=Fusarium anthophilum TaxID=48485 RepID=A0A8H5DY58_9HYPO|nr:hypothetical protein FANTH_9865 [Fusarium anthophilum]
MRTNEQGVKIACSRCRVGHRTSTCVNTPGHQDDVQVIRSAGRPAGSRTDPARAAVQREKKRRLRQTKALEEEEGVAALQESHAFPPRRAVSTPVQRGSAAGPPGFPITGDQNPGGLVNPQAPVPSRRYSAPPDPLSVGVPEPAQRPWEQPVHPGMDYRPASHTLAAPAPVSAPSVLGFPVTAPDHAASAVPSGMDGFSYVGVTGFPQDGMVAQADQGGSMIRQAMPENPMEAAHMVSSVASAPSPFAFSLNEGLGGVGSWGMSNTGQIGQPIPAASSGVPASGSQSPSASSAFLGRPTWENSLNTGVAGPGTLADQEVSASSGQDSWLDSALPANDPIAGGYQYDPGGGYGFPAETPGALFSSSYNYM